MKALRIWIFGLVAAVTIHAGLLAAILIQQDDGLAEADTGGTFDTVLTLTLNDGADTGTMGGDADRIAGAETEAATPLQAPGDRDAEPVPEAETAQPDRARAAELAEPLQDESADKPQSGQPPLTSQLESAVHITSPRSVVQPNKHQKAASNTTATQAPNKTVPIVENVVEATSQSTLESPQQQSEQVVSNPGEALSEPPHAPNPVVAALDPIDVPNSADKVPDGSTATTLHVPKPAPDTHYEARRTAAAKARQKATAEHQRKTVQGRQQGDSRETTKRGSAGQGTSAAAHAAKGDHKSYARTLRQWVERHKRYPVKARERGITGRGLLKITIARSGKVLSSSLVKSTGNGTLDAALKALPKRASPFPQMPSGLPGSRLTFSVPVSFRK
ncbi:TonB family protein [Roseibium hamelinense]|uniref:TonB family protein n=1 Tax=Roseibium hamelinense TaxID=150831 RepID=A0A562SNQ4_9HYPH|nr:TonB family protein [Roseibium hamelinense]MTI44278.1 TonB family protein [Roseibium hamelinense]TWI82949.1 TonB family protein [Roseibium hamelinense]